MAVYGGAAGGGKTWGLLVEPLRHVHNPNFGAVFFRRTRPEITRVGGAWPESTKIYPLLGGTPNLTSLYWRFPSGAQITFAHLQRPGELQSWQGSQIPLILWDQLEHFTEEEFFYMFSRNRSTCGVQPYVRASANPDASSWLAKFIGWWIGDDGYPLPERAGKIRYFIRKDEIITWADRPAEFGSRAGEAKSVTYIPATVDDNKILLESDPAYVANLEALPYIERMRLRRGNWKITNEKGEWPGEYFGDHIWFDEWPKDLTIRIISLDPSKGKDAKHGDYSAYIKFGRCKAGFLWIEGNLERRPTPRIVEDGFEHYRGFPCEGFGIETNQYQELLATEFGRVSKERGIMLPIFGLHNSVKKEVRIRRLGPYLARKVARFKSNSPGTRLLVQQLRDFPNGPHDDGPDAMEMALRLAIWLHNRGSKAAETEGVHLIGA